MRFPGHPRTLWLTLVLIAGLPRLIGAFTLPNAFGDAYVYIRDIGTMSTKLSAGTFGLTDFYGFWLPLYQFVSALFNVLVGNGFYAGKLVAALFGIGNCLVVYSLTVRLTRNQTAAMLGFALIALNPLHIFYSASAMTDIPHSFFVLTSLLLIVKRSWVWAAVFAALAGLTRVESWMLIALIPALQLLRERRVSFTALMIMVIPPLFWFYVSWKATGNWLACFESRQQYHDWLLQMNPALAHFSLSGVLRDGATLIVSTDIAVLIAVFATGWLCIGRLFWRTTGVTQRDETAQILAPVVFFSAFLALLLVAYLTHQQPMIFARYGLILFSLGIPVLVWACWRLRQERPALARRVLIAVVVICLLDASIQLASTVGSLNQISAQRAVADYLRDHFPVNSQARIFSDEGTVQVMSGLPPETFLSSSDAPRDREGFSNYLKAKNVGYVVFIDKGDSTLAKLFPELKDGTGNELTRPVFNARARFLRTNIWVYGVLHHAEGVK
jgi:hypothetical protein